MKPLYGNRGAVQVGNTHTFTYASNGLLQNLTDAVGRHVTLTYDSASGVPLLQNIEDWAGRVTTFSYDTTSVPGKPLMTEVTGPSGCQTQFEYDAVSSTGNPLLSTIIDPNGYMTQYTYDSQDRVATRGIPMTDLAGAPVLSVTTYSYDPAQSATRTLDALGNVTTYLYSKMAGATTGTVNPLGAASDIQRNQFGQETARRNPLGAAFTTTYDPRAMAVGTVDAMGNRTTVVRDTYNNPRQTIRPNDSVVTTVWGYAGSTFDTTGAKRRDRRWCFRRGRAVRPSLRVRQ